MDSRLAIYEGELEPVDFTTIQPPEVEHDKFIADIERRCPPIALFQQRSQTFVVRVLGVYPPHFDAYRQAQGWSYVEQDQQLWNGEQDKRKRASQQKTTLSARPDLWHMQDQNQKKFLVYCTEPSPESVSHWASMLSQLFHAHHYRCDLRAEYHADSAERFVRFTLQASNLVQALNQIKQQQGKRIITLLSYTPDIAKVMQHIYPDQGRVLSQQCGSFYHFKLWQAVNATPIVALDVAYNYRGELGFEFARQLSGQCDLGGLFYASKVAQHVAEDFAEGIVPGAYHILSPEGKIPGEVFTPTPLLKRFTSRAVHLSTPSTLISKRLMLHGMRFGANTTGNEMAYFAKGAICPFTALAVTAKDASNTAVMLLAMLREMVHLGSASPPLIMKSEQSECLEGQATLPLHTINPDTHAMGSNFNKYVTTKIPPVAFYENLPVKVLGVAPKDFEDYAATQGWHIMERVWDGSARVKENCYEAYLPPKVGNIERPSLFRVKVQDQMWMVMPVIPTYELVLHWAMLIKQIYQQVEAIFHPQSTLSFAEKSLQQSGLLQALPQHEEWMSGEAVLIIGYAKLTAQYLSSAGFRSPYYLKSDYKFQQLNSGFSYCLLKRDGYRSVFMINVDYCFWGSMAGALTQVLLQHSHLYAVVYVSKAGAVVGADALNDVYLPRSFSLMNVAGDIEPETLTAHFFSEKKELSHLLTGDHMCVATPVVETLDKVVKMKAYGSVTVDDEATHICRVAEKHKVRYGCLFFSSDMIAADKKSRDQVQPVNLTSHARTATEHKENVLENGVLNRLVFALKM